MDRLHGLLLIELLVFPLANVVARQGRPAQAPAPEPGSPLAMLQKPYIDLLKLAPAMNYRAADFASGYLGRTCAAAMNMAFHDFVPEREGETKSTEVARRAHSASGWVSQP